ncbi:MAG: diacylglycerol/lipid kinase family protein [Cellulosilyticaceae bacterium]
MKKAILLYNPMAGHRQIINHIDYIAERLQQMDYELRIYRSEAKGSIKQYIIDYVTEKNTDMILVSGGDGTLNECVNGMVLKSLKIPLGILPFGTANDFAYSACIPNNIVQVMNIIEDGNIEFVDIGQVNNEYFINVCNMGLFSGISHVVDPIVKNKFGKLAYYLKGIEELQHYHGISFELEIDEVKHTGEYILLLIFNGKAAGGFTKLALNASIQDGFFDMICIKKTDVIDIPRIFLKILQGEHLNDSSIDYFRAKKINIICHNEEENIITDIDGEEGPTFPINIRLKTDLICIYMPKQLEI